MFDRNKCSWCGEKSEKLLKVSIVFRACSEEHKKLIEENMKMVSHPDMGHYPGLKVKCLPDYCGWSGELRECKQRWVSTSPQSWRMLAGREGWEYDCPQCGLMVYNNYTRLS